MTDAERDLLDAARGVLWKLSHNHDLPDYHGPARLDRNDATVRDLDAAVEAYRCQTCGWVHPHHLPHCPAGTA